jgi:hypothetical protein
MTDAGRMRPRDGRAMDGQAPPDSGVRGSSSESYSFGKPRSQALERLPPRGIAIRLTLNWVRAVRERSSGHPEVGEDAP